MLENKNRERVKNYRKKDIRKIYIKIFLKVKQFKFKKKRFI